MRGLLSSAQNSLHSIPHEIGKAIAGHFDLFHDGHKPVALFIRVPFTRLSAFIELASAPVGFGHERSAGRWEFFAGRLQGVFCIEPAAGQAAP